MNLNSGQICVMIMLNSGQKLRSEKNDTSNYLFRVVDLHDFPYRGRDYMGDSLDIEEAK